MWYQNLPINMLYPNFNWIRWLVVSCRDQFYTYHCYAAPTTGWEVVGVPLVRLLKVIIPNLGTT